MKVAIRAQGMFVVGVNSLVDRAISYIDFAFLTLQLPVRLKYNNNIIKDIYNLL